MRFDIFRGLSAFPLTPTDAAGQVQPEPFVRFLERIVAVGPNSIGLLGSTGGYAYLTRDARRRAVEVAVECVEGRTPVIVGVGALRTDDAQDLARDAETAGANGLLLAPVSYTPLTDEEVYQHFAAVAGATGLPLCIYNNPSTTGFTFGPDLLSRLSALKTVRAVKMPLPKAMAVGYELARLRTVLPADFSVGYSGDWGAAEALLAGCDAWYSVVAGLLPEPAMRLAQAAQDGDAGEVGRMDNAFRDVWALFQEFGSFRVMYALADALSVAGLAPPRPVLPLSESVRPRVEAALERLSQAAANASGLAA